MIILMNVNLDVSGYKMIFQGIGLVREFLKNSNAYLSELNWHVIVRGSLN